MVVSLGHVSCSTEEVPRQEAKNSGSPIGPAMMAVLPHDCNQFRPLKQGDASSKSIKKRLAEAGAALSSGTAVRVALVSVLVRLGSPDLPALLVTLKVKGPLPADSGGARRPWRVAAMPMPK
jgi:hypothetical protein